ncbi:MAG: carbonic anhydrase [Phycisphaerales bacterium]
MTLIRTSLIIATILCAGAAFALDDHGTQTETRREGPVTITTAKPATTAKSKSTPEAKSPPTIEMKPKTIPGDEASAAISGSEHTTKADKNEKPVKFAGKANPSEDSAMNAEAALRELLQGNERWVSGKVKNPNIEAALRAELAEAGQKPFATIVSCSDSRMPVERIFDRGVGDLFTVRVAGSVAGISETGTVEYGVGHLHTPLLVVMAHTKCGAVKAALTNAPVHGALKNLVDKIGPSVERARRNNPGASDEQLLAAAVKENVWQTIFDLYKNSGELREAALKGEVKVVGAVCDISTGKVEFLGEHPWQRELIAAMEPVPGATASGEK